MGAPQAILAVPGVDISDLKNRKHEISQQLLQAAEGVGFFYVTGAAHSPYSYQHVETDEICKPVSEVVPSTGHGLPQEDIDAAFATTIQYNNLPEEVRECHVKDKSNAAYILGWSERQVAAGRLTHGIVMGYDTPRMEGLWPTQEECPGFKKNTLDFMHKAAKVADDIMSCFAIGLGLPEDYYREPMDPNAADCQTVMSYNHYPSWERNTYKEGTLRRIAHTDFELLTLLFQRPGEPGLEVCAGKGTNPKEAMRSGLWVPCDPVPGAITVNIGDALQYWSDGRLKSTFHRVRMPRKDEYQGDRYSIAYFANAHNSTLLQGPKKLYPPVTFPQILEQKKKYKMSFMKQDDMTDEEYLEFQKKMAIGPEFEMVVNAAATEPTV